MSFHVGFEAVFLYLCILQCFSVVQAAMSIDGALLLRFLLS